MDAYTKLAVAPKRLTLGKKVTGPKKFLLMSFNFCTYFGSPQVFSSVLKKSVLGFF